MITATFTGQDGSMGFRVGRKYRLNTYIHRNLLWVETVNKEQSCGYSSVENFLANWKLEETA